MTKKNVHRLSVASVAALLFLFTFSLFTLPLTSAVSATTTGLVTMGFDRNIGKHVTVGDFDIYCFDNMLVFYTSAAVTAKTWTIPINETHAYAQRDTAIMEINSTYVLVAQTFATTTGQTRTKLQYFVVNVDSLAYTDSGEKIMGDDYGSTTSQSDLVLYKINDKFFCFFGSKINSANRAYVAQLLPTYTVSYQDNASHFIYGSTVAFLNNADTGVSVLSQSAVGSSRFALWFIDEARTVTSGGLTGSNDTCGVYWNFFGSYIENVLSGTNTVMDVLVSFGYTSGSVEAVKVELLRFNATYFSIAASVASSLEMYGTVPRVIGLGSTSVTAFDALTDGTFGAVYLNNVGALYGYNVDLADLDTAAPSLSGSGLEQFQGLVFLFGGSTDAGGLIDAWGTVGLMVDYTGSRCAAEIVTPLSSTVTYLWSVNPDPVYADYSNNLIQLAASSTYTYTGIISVNFVAAQGSVRIQDTVNPANFAIKQIDVNGHFTFNLYTTTQATEYFYDINITLTNFSGNYLTNLHVLSLSGSQTPPTATPTVGPIGGGGNLDSGSLSVGMTTFINFMVLFLCIGAPAILLGVMAGAPGLIGGAILGLGVGVIAGLVPFWFIFLVGVVAVLVLVMWRNNTPQKTGD